MEIQRLAVGPFQSNCYIIGPSLEGIRLVVDPGDEAERIISGLDAAGGGPDAILLTHAHLDHVGAVAALVERYGAPVYLHADDRPLYDRAADQAAAFGLTIRPPPPPDFDLADRDRVTFGDISFEIRHTPGHSPGHVVFIAPGVAFVGDDVFAGSIGRTDLPGGDSAALMCSIREHILTLPPDTVLLSGHGPETTVAREAESNPFLADTTPCLRCGVPLPSRVAGCKGGRCPHCGHNYPHGDCSDV